MNKYAPLTQHLENMNGDSWKTSFSEVEDILGFPLPKSARQYREWWANDVQNGRHWISTGWRTSDVNLGNEIVTFVKNNLLDTKTKKNNPAVQILADDCHQWDGPCRTECRVVMEWRPLGRVMLDQRGRLAFPKPHSAPALYRLRIRTAKREALYIGETDNLKRRFGNYRNPGSTQQTSLRINAELKKALNAGAEVSVSIVAEGQAWIDKGKGLEAVNLGSKVLRCLFENAAILDSGGTDVEGLNRAS